MKAVIMCGGEGSRLRPLTCDTPKPMTRLCGRPTLTYILDLLKGAGIDEAILTLKYLPEKITAWFDENPYDGIKLNFIKEDKPLGTAGSVKNAEKLIGDGDFIVISGDSLCDLDLSSIIEVHRKKRAYATIALHEESDPREYGVAVIGEDGRIGGFVEKPDWSEAVSDKANTGIYVLNSAIFRLIPENTAFDFAQDLFPLMLKKNYPIFGFVTGGYWCDIGDIGTYMSCQRDMLNGLVRVNIPKQDRPRGNYTVNEPVFIGKNVTVGDGAVIGSGSVLDDGCNIGENAQIKNSVVLSGAYIGKNSELSGALVCAGASIGEETRLFEGAVIGSRTTVGKGTEIANNVRVWPEKHIGSDIRLTENVKWGDMRLGIFGDDGVCGECGVDVTPELCTSVGRALVAAAGNNIAIADDGKVASLAYKKALVSGVQTAGGQVFDLSDTWKALLAWSTAYLKLDAGIYVHSDKSEVILSVYGADGLPLSTKIRRKTERIIYSGELSHCDGTLFKEPVSMQGMSIVYRNWLMSVFPAELKDMKFGINTKRADIRNTAVTLFSTMGAEIVKDNPQFEITYSGERIIGYTESGKNVSAERMEVILAAIEMMSGYDVAVLFDAPNMTEKLAARYKKRVYRYTDSTEDEGVRNLALCQPQLRDGIAAILRIVSYMSRNRITLDKLNDSVPEFTVVRRDFPLQQSVGKFMEKLSSMENGTRVCGGVTVTETEGVIYARPFRRGGGIRIYAEAVNEETAKELCDGFEKLM